MRAALALLACLLLPGCASLSYYWQAVTGHLELMQAARPVHDWLQDPKSPEPLKQRLALASRIRAFAVQQLHLPDSRSYQSYVQLQRPAALWNVVAAPELSLRPQLWCFPVAGCVSYKGYYSEAAAQHEAQALRTQGLDVVVLPVPAYSTLGWLNWAGGDPLLSSFLGYPEGDLAGLIFHEMAHQVVYVGGDTAFNESFATAVERLGGAQWLAQAGDEARAQHAAQDARRRAFRQLALGLRRELAELYGETEALRQVDDAPRAVNIQPTGAARERLLERKQAVWAQFRHRYAQLRQDWGGFAGYDAWVARSNNAALAALADYEDLTPAFEALFRQTGSWPRFYEEARRLARLPQAERHAALRSLVQPLSAQAVPRTAQ
jgi:predicted aminopeptidase